MARNEGKIIDTRKMKDGDGNLLLVRIHMTTDFRTVQFYATCPAVPLLKTDKRASVDETLADAKAELVKVKGVTWKRQLRVKLTATKPEKLALPKGMRGRVELDYTLRLEVDEYEIGMSGDKEVYRQRRLKNRWHSKDEYEYTDIREGTPIEGMYYRDEDDNKTCAMIDDTPENRAALMTILGMLNQLDARLKEFLGPDKLTETLALVAAGVPLAIAGPPETRKKGKR